jgi:hypothetical protein
MSSLVAFTSLAAAPLIVSAVSCNAFVVFDRVSVSGCALVSLGLPPFVFLPFLLAFGFGGSVSVSVPASLSNSGPFFISAATIAAKLSTDFVRVLIWRLAEAEAEAADGLAGIADCACEDERATPSASSSVRRSR